MLSADLVNKGNEPVAFPIAFLPRRHTPLTAGAIQFRTRNTSGVTRTDQNRARNLRNPVHARILQQAGPQAAVLATQN
jgi:hypothetical protein